MMRKVLLLLLLCLSLAAHAASLGALPLGSTLPLTETPHDYAGIGSASADAVVTFRVYEGAFSLVESGTFSPVDPTNTTGFHGAGVVLDSATGYESDGYYTLLVTIHVDSATFNIRHHFTVVPATSVSTSDLSLLARATQVDQATALIHEASDDTADRIEALDFTTDADLAALAKASQVDQATALILGASADAGDDADSLLAMTVLEGGVRVFSASALQNTPPATVDSVTVSAEVTTGGFTQAALAQLVSATVGEATLATKSVSWWARANTYGQVHYVYTVTNEDIGAPVAGAKVIVTADAIGDQPITGGGSDAFGEVDFYLDPGSYYVWITHPAYVFSNPITLNVPEE